MPGSRVEIITGRKRRRHWSDADKLRIVVEAEEPGGCFAHVAQRHEVSRGLLWNWRTQVRRGTLRLEPSTVFVPVRVADVPVPATVLAEAALSRSTIPPRAAEDQIEVELPDGSKLRVGAGVSLVVLRRLVAALRQ